MAGAPSDWTKRLQGHVREDTTDVLSGRASLRYELHLPGNYVTSDGTLLTNSTKKHPRGFAVPPGAKGISFWYQWKAPYEKLFAVISNDTFDLSGNENWQELLVLFTGLSDSIKIEFVWRRLTETLDANLLFRLDQIEFYPTQSSVPILLENRPIEFFPNPITAKANLHINVKGGLTMHFKIIDLAGTEVLRLPSTISAEGQMSIPLDVDNLPNGVYYLQCNIGEDIVTLKFIVSH